MKQQIIDTLKSRGASDELIASAEHLIDWAASNFTELPKFYTMNNEHRIEWEGKHEGCFFAQMGADAITEVCPMRVHRKDFELCLQEEKDGDVAVRVNRFRGSHCAAEARSIAFPNIEDLDAMFNWFKMEEF